MTELIRLNAGNDRNGNPRRIYAELAAGQVSRAWDEGYAGPHAVPADLRHAAANCATLSITAAQYRALLKLAAWS
jgi:hypothetical protein